MPKYKKNYITADHFELLQKIGVDYEGFVEGVGYVYNIYVAFTPPHMDISVPLRYAPPGMDQFIIGWMQCIDSSEEIIKMSYGDKETVAVEEGEDAESGGGSNWGDYVGYGSTILAGIGEGILEGEKAWVNKNFYRAFTDVDNTTLGYFKRSNMAQVNIKWSAAPKVLSTTGNVATLVSMVPNVVNIYQNPNDSYVVCDNMSQMMLTAPSMLPGWYGVAFGVLNKPLIKARDIGAKNLNEINSPMRDWHYGSLWSSDSILKENIHVIDCPLEKVLSLGGYRYTWKDSTNNTDIGVIAQEVEKVFPEAVQVEQSSNTKQVYYYKLIPVLIEAIKEQQGIIVRQQAELEKIKKQIAESGNN